MTYNRDEPPLERAFRLLRQSSTPHGSYNSVNTTSSNLNLSNGDGAPALNFASSLQSPDPAASPDIIIVCRNVKCGASAPLDEARQTYKTCHNCYSYYCSRECRKIHWERHKQKCLFSRVNSLCKRVIRKIHEDPVIKSELSQMARTGYLSHGRGAVLFVFAAPEEAAKFIKSPWNRAIAPPVYVSVQDITNTDLFGDQMFELSDMCKAYNPEIKFVLEVIVIAGEDIPLNSLHRREGPAIKKCVKLHMASVHTRQQTKPRLEADTLILTAVPGSEFTENMEGKKAREICFINIQRQLRQRGVSLRHEFPDIYNRLCAYVVDNEHFTPITLFPINSKTKKRFMCLIMPNSEPEIDWMDAPDLLEELGLENSV
ncbi:hypothetical protein CAPTEDRAFT_100074 [Capitella teleta]|uniref:MYND-type domain-containing protein n=1 Tax=Capitella teleta TaxID=283909 RepID=R7TMN5_CAPTE|nr:hypothetical protein CAPTEDRAFT_100074 [Capitella teleta]|eukprot:ELT92335.1 hypothetical protein CAPTEDRAFT_100074 [Capitella teleta]